MRKLNDREVQDLYILMKDRVKNIPYNDVNVIYKFTDLLSSYFKFSNDDLLKLDLKSISCSEYKNIKEVKFYSEKIQYDFKFEIIDDIINNLYVEKR